MFSADLRRVRGAEASRLWSQEHVAADTLLLRPCRRVLGTRQHLGPGSGQAQSSQRVLPSRSHRADVRVCGSAGEITAQVSSCLMCWVHVSLPVPFIESFTAFVSTITTQTNPTCVWHLPSCRQASPQLKPFKRPKSGKWKTICTSSRWPNSSSTRRSSCSRITSTSRSSCTRRFGPNDCREGDGVAEQEFGRLKCSNVCQESPIFVL